MNTIIICDDVEMERQMLHELLLLYFEETKDEVTILEYESGESLIADVEEGYLDADLLFLDISEVYRRQNIYGKFLKPLAKEAEGLDCGKTERWSVFRQEMKKWQKHLRILFAEEISSALVTTGTEQVLDMVVKLEWMAMEYAVLWQVLFLQQLQGEITYEKMKESVCVIFRMMGYADEDIWEYMENCFDSVVWPWEYYSMLV